METVQRLVLNKEGKPIGKREVTAARDFMCFLEGDYLYLVKPVDPNPRKESVMEIPKAIDILDDFRLDATYLKTPDLKTAISLGIEALKRLEEHRIDNSETAWQLLPGETKE